MRKVHVFFLWHHHQPFYRDLHSNRMAMPWVRLHGIKDYIGMVNLVREFPEFKCCFNLAPSLLVQIEDYVCNGAQDMLLEIANKPTAELDERERIFLLNNSFAANWKNMVLPYIRYAELLEKRDFERLTAKRALKHFSDQELLDLQVWSNLAWFHQTLCETDSFLRGLIEKGRDFNEQEKAELLNKEQEVLGGIIPAYRELQEAGQIEISTSPFYHPILPLLYDMEAAHAAMPDIPLPSIGKDMREDAAVHVQKAREMYQATFGRPPRGMWPAEGAVSAETVPIYVDAGIKWIATDEEILEQSLGKGSLRDVHAQVREPDVLYAPYSIACGNDYLDIVFRDHYLADLVGFGYSRKSPKKAVEDMMQQLHRIAQHESDNPALVSIILDGENAWENYPRNGVDFLRDLYGAICRDPHIAPVCLSDYLEEHPPTRSISNLFAGSWIKHNFAIWVGHEDDRKAWEYVGKVRDFLEEETRKRGGADAGPELKAAWEELYVTEGSDWYWWYGDDRTSGYDEEFDALFRRHLKNVYELLGVSSPRFLDEPIVPISAGAVFTPPRAFLHVTIDGRRTSFFEWISAGRYRTENDVSTMEKSGECIIQEVYFGFDKDRIFIRIDSAEPLKESLSDNARIMIFFSEPREVALIVEEIKGVLPTVSLRTAGKEIPSGGIAAVDFIAEIGCPFSALGFSEGERVSFFVELQEDEQLLERVPRAVPFVFTVPSKNFDREMWHV